MRSRVLWIWLVVGTLWIVLVACNAAYGQGRLDTGGWRIGADASVGLSGGCSSGACRTGACPTPMPRPQRWAQPNQAAPPRGPRPQPRAQARTPCPAIVQIHSKRGDSTKKGTGSVVAWENWDGGRALILTCAHILQAGWKPVVLFPDGPTRQEGSILEARVLVADALHDCALLEVQTPSVRCIRLAAAPPSSGPVAWEGYGQGGYATSTGQVIGIDGDFLKIEGETRNGDSGAPIWDSGGALVSVLNDASQFPGEPWQVAGPHIGWIRGLIAEHWKSPPQTIPGPPPPVTPDPPPILIPIPDPWPDQEAGPCIGLAEIQVELAELRKAIAELTLKPGIPGPPGPAGPAGLTPTIKPWYLRTVDARTGEETITEINPGDTVTLKLYEYPRITPK